MISFVWIHMTFGLNSSNTMAQRTEQSPAWDANNERGTINNCQKAQRIVFTSSLFKHHTTVYVFAQKAGLWMSALHMSGKNRNCLKSPLGVWTNLVYKTSWASLPAKQQKQAITVGSSSGFNVRLLRDWSNFDLPKLMPVKHISLMSASCLSITITIYLYRAYTLRVHKRFTLIKKLKIVLGKKGPK